MGMEGIVLGISLAIIVAVFVYAPFNRARGQAFTSKTPARDEELAELLSKKNSILMAIKDLDFDYEQGKLSEGDYLELRDHYRKQAVVLLKQIDELQAERSQKKRSRKGQACPECGERVRKGDKYCSTCGTKL
jgi:uncharacterized protein with PIN domain